MVAAALDAGVVLEAAFVESASAERAEADELCARLRDAGVTVVEVRDGTLAGATATVTPQGIVAVATMSPGSVSATGLAASSDGVLGSMTGLVVVLVGVGDPGNAGTIVRSAEAAGAGAVVFCGGSVDPYSPKCVRATAGSLFHVSVVSGGDPVEVLEGIGAQGWRRVGASSHRGAPYRHAELGGLVAVVLGSEAHGLTPAVAGEIDDWVHIPMRGRVESLNVAVAGSLLCFEVARRHEQASGADSETAALG